MDKRDEIISQQLDLIRNMTERNLSRLSTDIWGVAEKPRPPGTDLPVYASSANAGSASTPEPAKAEAASQEPLEGINDLKAELDSYIGLETVKKEVKNLINLVSAQTLRKAHGLPASDMSLHMVFSGNPGTGKTMIARLIGRFFRSLGILSKGQLVEVDRGGLVAGYVGQTAIKTGQVLETALGGVLFIDEAYSLTSGGENDFGAEAVDIILKAMEDHRDDLVVIVAGYTELMEGFVSSNPGLKSRFNRYLFFPDYTIDEMVAIFTSRCEKSFYHIDNGAEPFLKIRLTEKSVNRDFGNARGVRNFFENVLVAQANRLATMESITKEDLMLITSQDIEDAE